TAAPVRPRPRRFAVVFFVGFLALVFLAVAVGVRRLALAPLRAAAFRAGAARALVAAGFFAAALRFAAVFVFFRIAIDPCSSILGLASRAQRSTSVVLCRPGIRLSFWGSGQVPHPRCTIHAAACAGPEVPESRAAPISSFSARFAG